MTYLRRAFVISALCGVPALTAQVDGRTRAQLLRKGYLSSTTAKQREYFLLLPAGYETEKGKLWPVILFLHGGGERGDGLTDLDKTLKHGPLMEAWEKGRDLPFIMIGPQLPAMSTPSDAPPRQPPAANPTPSHMSRNSAGVKPRFADEGPPQGWWTVEKDLVRMVDETLAGYRADPDRVYLTGLSYGGFGTWHMAGAHAGRWAAVAPVCGASDPRAIPVIAGSKLPIWIFQGGRDPVVRAEWVLESAVALQKAGHPEVRFTVHEDMSHNVWTRVYEGLDLYNWFLSHRRERRTSH